MPAEMTHKVLKFSITFYTLFPHSAIDKSIHMHNTACCTSKEFIYPVHHGYWNHCRLSTTTNSASYRNK